MNVRRLFPFLPLLVLTLVLITQGGFAMIEELSLSNLVAMSDIIVVATLKSTRNLGPDADGLMKMENVLTVETSLKGAVGAGADVIVDTLGGWEDSVEFHKGQRALVFLVLKEEGKSRYEVTNYVQGHWPLDEKGLPMGMGTDKTLEQVKAEIRLNRPKPAPKAPPEPEF